MLCRRDPPPGGGGSARRVPAVTAAMWRAYNEGQITEPEAEDLSLLIEARRTCADIGLPAPDRIGSPVRRSVGSRPRTGASMERRRRWAASGRLPPGLAARFTLAEQAVLALVAAEVCAARGLPARSRSHRGDRRPIRDDGAQRLERGSQTRPGHGGGAARDRLSQRHEHHPHRLGRMDRLAAAGSERGLLSFQDTPQCDRGEGANPRGACLLKL